MNLAWKALAREAGVAAEQLAIGASAIHKASYTHPAYYGQMFFALSAGLERSAKLALVVDHAIDHAGQFPDNKTVRKYGHDLHKLLADCDEIAFRRGFTDPEQRLPRTPIHTAIIKVLSTFATNVTRYYNLDVITSSAPKTAEEPVRDWVEAVTVPVLGKHYKWRERQKHANVAAFAEAVLGEHVKVVFTSDTGEPITTLRDASLRAAETQFAKPYTRMYVMQIIRFMALLLSDLGYAAQAARLDNVPALSDFYRIFNNPDAYLRSRTSWSIYRLR